MKTILYSHFDIYLTLYWSSNSKDGEISLTVNHTDPQNPIKQYIPCKLHSNCLIFYAFHTAILALLLDTGTVIWPFFKPPAYQFLQQSYTFIKFPKYERAWTKTKNLLWNSPIIVPDFSFKVVILHIKDLHKRERYCNSISILRSYLSSLYN